MDSEYIVRLIILMHKQTIYRFIGYGIRLLLLLISFNNMHLIYSLLLMDFICQSFSFGCFVLLISGYSLAKHCLV